MVKYKKLVFVCMENTCRSPMAEAIYHSLVSESQLEVMSRGLVVLFSEPLNPKVAIVTKNHELSVEEHKTRALVIEDIQEDTLILTMTEQEKEKILEDYQITENVFTIKEFAGEIGDVIDPYGGSLIEYEACYVELARLVKKTVLKLDKEE